MHLDAFGCNYVRLGVFGCVIKPKAIHILRILRRMWIMSTGRSTKSWELPLRHGKAARVADIEDRGSKFKCAQVRFSFHAKSNGTKLVLSISGQQVPAKCPRPG